jgi:sporulation protein YlmC with PRC-barrel domain
MLTQFLVTAGLAVALAAPALAQGTTTAPGSADKGTAGAPSTTGSSGATERMKPDQLRASKLIGKNVYGPDDKSIGDVADLILDKDGRVDRVIVAVGGLLGIGDKHIAVPMNEVKWGQEDRLTVNMTKEQLKDHPSYEYAERAPAARTGSSTAPGGGAPASRPGAGPTSPPASRTQ